MTRDEEARRRFRVATDYVALVSGLMLDVVDHVEDGRRAPRALFDEIRELVDECQAEFG